MGIINQYVIPARLKSEYWVSGHPIKVDSQIPCTELSRPCKLGSLGSEMIKYSGAVVVDLPMTLNRELLEPKKSVSMLPGFKVHDLKKNVDERGFFAEIYRDDWKDLLGDDKVVQANLSYSYPGMIRAWHRHNRGQVDYFIIVKGALKICAYDDRPGSSTKGQLAEVVASGERLQSVRVPGFYWHGTKAVGNKPTLAVYCVNRMYDAQNPDEERRAWNDNSIIDSRTGRAYDWNMPPHK